MSVVFIPVGIILLVTYFMSRKKSNDQEIEAKRKELISLKQQIAEATNELENISVNKTVNLTVLEDKVLDMYERSNIRIPSDIVEDFHAMNFKSQSHAIDYLETQRNHWKLENSKKLYKGGR